MRCLLKASIPVEAGNAKAKNGTLGSLIESILAELKPEAAYFLTEKGRRTALLFIDLQDPSQIPAVVEPFFLAFNARVTITPAMTAEDLMKGAQGIEEAVKKYA
ncbi:MAG: hypothetical protein O7C72_04645 [Deltaproteobacteria bacterium]|nr:hypothetical protein [Deltaproteobacteria bacterium]